MIYKKFLNKLFSVFISLCLIMPIFTSYANSVDNNGVTAPNSTDEYFKVLIALGTFGNAKVPNLGDGLSREMFVGGLVSLTQIDCSAYSAVPVFNDVTNDVLSQQINMLISKSAISVTKENFRPNEKITYNEAVKILVSFLGYSFIAEEIGSYPAGYITQGMKIGLLKGVDTDNGKITTADIIKLFYNSLNVQVLSIASIGDGQKFNECGTLLAYYRDIYSVEGIVLDNGYASINGSTNLNGSISVNGYIINSNNVDCSDILGYNIKAYYKQTDDSDQSYLVVYTKSNSKNDVVVVNAKDLDPSSDNTKIVYSDSENPGNKAIKQYNILPTANVIYNGSFLGKAYLASKEDSTTSLCVSDFIPKDGTVELIDLDKNGDYDLVIIKNYISSIVSSVSVDIKTINLKNLNSISLADYKNYKILFSGTEIALKDIKALDVIDIAFPKSNQTKYIELNVSRKTTTGEVKEISDDGKIKIGEVTLEYDYQYFNDYPLLMLNDNVTVYTNSFGKIIASNKVIIRNNPYGYVIMSSGKINSLSDRLKLKIIGGSGYVETLECIEKVIIDGVKVDLSKYILTPYQLIRIYKNSDNKVTKILTKNNTTNEFKLNKPMESKKYNGAVVSPTVTTPTELQSQYMLDESSSIFYVPDPNSAADPKNPKYYKVTSIGGIKTGVYNIAGYDFDPTTNVAKAAVVTSNSYSYNVSDGSVFCVVTKILKVCDEDGNNTTWIKGFLSSAYQNEFAYPIAEDVRVQRITATYNELTGVSVRTPAYSEPTANANVNDIKPGYTIQFALDSIKNEIAHIAFYPNDGKFYDISPDSGGEIVYGKISSIDNGIMRITETGRKDSKGNALDLFYKFKSLQPSLFLYNSRSKTATQITFSEIPVGANATIILRARYNNLPSDGVIYYDNN